METIVKLNFKQYLYKIAHASLLPQTLTIKRIYAVPLMALKSTAIWSL